MHFSTTGPWLYRRYASCHVLSRADRFAKTVALGMCTAGLAVSLAGCVAEASEDSASQQPKTDLYASQQAFASEDMESGQTIAQIDALSTYASYVSENEEGESLQGADALAFDLFLRAFADDPSNASVRIAQGGLYVPTNSETVLVEQSQDATGGGGEREATGWPTFEPSEEQSISAASSYTPLLGFATKFADDSLSSGSLYIFDADSFALVEVTSDLQFALSSGYSDATEYAAAISAGRLALLPGRNADDFAQTLWCTMKTNALDYDAINAALDAYWGDTQA